MAIVGSGLTQNRRPTGPAGNGPAPARVVGLVQLWAPETGVAVGGRYSEPPQVVAERAANGAWTAVPRLKRRPLSSWSGPQPVKIECKIRLGGDVRVPVSYTLETIRSLQDRLPGEDADDRPPYLRVIGYVPGHYATVKWQIDGLEIVELDHVAGEPAQALMTLTLAEWVSSEITTRPPKDRTPARKKPWLKRDTLKKFAKRWLGTSGPQATRAIRRANPSIKSWQKVPEGKKITVPASTPTSR